MRVRLQRRFGERPRSGRSSGRVRPHVGEGRIAAPGRLRDRLVRKGFAPRHVAEIGVHHPDRCQLRGYIDDGTRCTLVEPEPDAVEAIRRRFGELAHVVLHAVALCDRHGRVEMIRRAASTYLAEVARPPAVVNDGYRPRERDRFSVPATTFDTIDDGTIELLSVDVEGSEWYVIERMVSRPAVISVETHGSRYRNPHADEIGDWMARNGYVVWYRDRTDTVWVRPQRIRVGLGERVARIAADLRITARRLRKTLAAWGRARGGARRADRRRSTGR
ncbi:MAG TPA: FkbM family methyltransferase [Candidatus Polarisedimenticolaceae bacterium]|nr:FkbM family methyltransferase [Candidatus Polarisedimenticolaceae bacterium]